MNLREAMSLAKTLYGGFKPENMNTKGWEDYPKSGYLKDDLASGSDVTLVDVEAKSNTTLIFMGLSASGLDKTLITVYGPESRPIIKDLAGATIGQGKEGHEFMVPHMVKPGKSYQIVAKNISASAITKLTGFITVYGAKVEWG